MFELFKKAAVERPSAIANDLVALQTQIDEATDRITRAGYSRSDIDELLNALPAADRAAIATVAERLAENDRAATSAGRTREAAPSFLR
jgi:hypothetical protein